MKLVVADTGAIITLIHVNQLHLIEAVFGQLAIAPAVWQELSNYDNPDFDQHQIRYLAGKVSPIVSSNYLSVVMDTGESESVILYRELKANLLLIDDQKARFIAESLGVNCIGSLGLLIQAKKKGLILELRPLFMHFLVAKRFFSRNLLNEILRNSNEKEI